MLLPSLMEIMTGYIKNINNHHAKLSRDLFFTAVENSINGIISSYKRIGTVEFSHNGEFLRNMDEIFAMIDHPNEKFDINHFDELTKWILKHSLTVAKASNKDDEAEITRTCQKILSEVNNIKKEATKAQTTSWQNDLHILGNIFELLEQNVNGALLRLVITSLPNVSHPLDNLLTTVLSSDLDATDRLSDDISDQIKNLDNQTDKIFQLCHLCIYCTTDQDKAQKIRSIGKVFEILETDLVPSILQMYFNPDDAGCKAFVKILRQLWKSLLEELSSVILSIVDPTAYCVILLQEMTELVRALKDDLYNQDTLSLKTMVHSLLGKAETGVDLAWKEVADKSNQVGSIQPLSDGHPLVVTERSIWEVRAASKLVLASVQDLSLHQSLQKRVQVLITSFEDVVQLLTEKQEEASQDSSRILGSLLHITNASENVKTPATSGGQHVTNCLSFRSKLNLDKTAAIAKDLRREMYKLTVDLTPFTPKSQERLGVRPSLKRKPSKVTVNGCVLETPIKRSEQGSRIVRKSSARLSSVINELSVLSHELSVCLESSEGQQYHNSEISIDKENILECKDLDKNTKNNSLRRAALKNMTNKVVLTASKINL